MDLKINNSNILCSKNVFLVLGLAIIYYLAGMLLLSFSPPSFCFSPFLPIAGLFVFCVLHYGLKVLPAVFIGQFLLCINFAYSTGILLDTQQLLLYLGFALNMAFFIFLARYLVLRYSHFDGTIFDKTNIPLMLILAGPVSSFFPVLICLYLLFVSGFGGTEDFWYLGIKWWLSQSFSVVISLPVLLLLFDSKEATINQKLLILISVVVLLITTLQMFKYTEKQETQYLESILENRARILAQDIKNEMQGYMHSARHLSVDFIEGRELSLEEFEQFSAILLTEHSTIEQLQWGVYVSNDERERFENALKNLYQNEYHIKEISSSGVEKIAPLKSHYYPVKYVYPYDANQSVLGVDPSVGGGVLNNLLIAIENSEDTLSEGIAVGHNSANHVTNIFLYTPLFINQKDGLLIERKFTGYLIQLINLSKFFDGLTSRREYRNMQIELNDSSVPSGLRLYKNKYEENINLDNRVNVLHSFYLANKVWSIALQADKHRLMQQSISTKWSVLISGLMLTMIIVVVLLLLIRKQQQVQALLDNKTEIVKQSQSYQNMLAATFNTHQAILITNPEYNIIRVNSAFCNIMGYTEIEVVGENPRMLASGRQSKEFYKEMWSKLLGTGRYEGEIWNRRKNGEIFPEYQTITEIRNAKGEIIYYISVFSDITKLKQDEEKIRHQAFYDQLTLLPNKMLFLDRLDQEVAYARRFNGVGALLLIDIDDFKSINDSIGHHFGDDVLIELGGRLTSMLRDTDTVAHLGGDDYIVFMPVEKCNEQEALQHASLIAEKILKKIKEPFFINNVDYKLTASLGISFIKNNKCSSSDILRQAESALYNAKMAGKNGFRTFLGD